MIRPLCGAFLLLPGLAAADLFQAEVHGVGCHTRQLAIQKIWSSQPGVTSVTIQPRGPNDPANRRVFVLNSARPLDRDSLQAALGDRSRFYQVLTVTRKDSPTPSLSKPVVPTKVRP